MSRWNAVEPDVTISPPFGELANALIARSISAELPTLMGNQLDRLGGHGLDNGELPNPKTQPGIADHCDPCHVRRDLPQQLQPFTADPVFELGKPGRITAWMGHARDKNRCQPDRQHL